MAENTTRLDLLMKNPLTDGADTFNIETMLNENWQRIDDNVAMVDASGKVINKDGTPAGGVTATEFANHKTDGAAHGIGDKSTLLTTNKTSIVAAINEAFTLGNSKKKELVDKLLLLDPSLLITHNSTWEEIFNVTGQISTGFKTEKGTVASPTVTLTVRGLPFRPKMIATRRSDATGYSLYSSVYVESELLSGATTINHQFTTSSTTANAVIYDDGFSIGLGHNSPVKWVAVG